MNINLKPSSHASCDTNGQGLALQDLVQISFTPLTLEESKKLIRSGAISINNNKIKDVLFNVKGSTQITIEKGTLRLYKNIVVT